MDLKPVIVVSKQSDLSSMIRNIEKASFLSVDTESNSFHAYYNRICLIQISTSEEDYVIDPLSLISLNDLGEIFANPEIEKIFHAAPNDISGLKRDYKFQVRHIFDTSIAAKMLGYEQLGLAKILYDSFGVRLNKKWQRHDWGKRPLLDEQLEYARYDTHFLIPLRHRLASELESKNLIDFARIAFGKACDQEFHVKPFRPGHYLRLGGAQSLDLAGKRILQALYLYRENEARRRDRAPFRIFTNETLVRLALQRPKSIQEFLKIKGIPRSYINAKSAYPLIDLIRRNDWQVGEEAIIQKK